MARDLKSIIGKLKQSKREESKRGRVVVYLHKPLFKEFQEYCEKQGLSASRVIEEVIRTELSESKKK